MLVLGIDPSSSICGLALIEGQEIVETDAWYSPKNGSAPERLTAYYRWLAKWIEQRRPQVGCVEFLSVERNAATTRIVSHYQAASAIACKDSGMLTIEARVTSARKAVFGDGSLSKQAVFERVKKIYPEHDFGRATKGGYDRADALCLALAAWTIAEM